MPKLNVEQSDQEKPIILIVGDNILVDSIIPEYQKEFKIALISDRISAQTPSDFYRIDEASAHLVENLEEKIDYAIIFLDSADRKHLASIFGKLAGDRTKTAIIIDVQKINSYTDIILEFKKSDLFYFTFVAL